QGGLDSRYVAGVAPQLIASVTSVGTPHKGSKVAETVLKLANNEPTGLLEITASALVNAAGYLISGLSGGGGYNQNALGALDTLSLAGSARFNQRFPAGVPTSACGNGITQTQGIKLYSWGGTRPFTHAFDPLESLFVASSVVFMGEASDGMVGRCSNRFGQVIRDNYAMNHGDLVNQVFGLVNLFETNPKTVYRQHANRLRNANL
ncbi:MAG: triacylglycerol lipase, partial [Pseudomonadota bacterium]|nr:triacylglycerol lipase [Pseudomonadota bacterium]